MSILHSIRTARHWIDGEWLEIGTPGTSISPASGDEIGQYWLGGPEVARLAVRAAKRAFEETHWKTDRIIRSRVLNELADRFETRAEELIELLSIENGKIPAHAKIEIGIVPLTLRFNAALALTDTGRAAELPGGHLSVVIRQPAGVAAIIAPWNAPVALVTRSLAPALAAGATVAVMMPRQTAQVNALIAEIIAEVFALPRGVINIFTGGPDAGQELVVSPDVPVISFTGSTATGRAIAANAAPYLKRLSLELGGKTPMIVFDDADLNAAVAKIVESITVFAGQFCMAGSRLLAQRAISRPLCDALVKRLTAIHVGPGSDPKSQMGPLIDRATVERVERMVVEAIQGGAKPLLRGGPFSEGRCSNGAFFSPAFLEVDDPKAPIVQREVFGPVLTMQVFDDEAQAIALANDTEYGLAASVWSRDVDRPLRVAKALHAGTVWINNWAVLFDQFEEGGFKQSGLGRMRGLAAIEDFLESKHIALTPG